MVYLNQTKDNVRIIECDNLQNLYTWVDDAYAVHPNMRRHTGGVMSMGLDKDLCPRWSHILVPRRCTARSRPFDRVFDRLRATKSTEMYLKVCNAQLINLKSNYIDVDYIK